MARIHIFGAAGSGVTTLGKELAQTLSIPVFDTDNYYWKNTSTPFTVKNSVDERYQLLLKDLSHKESWIISGSMDSWCEPFLPLFQLAIFLYTPIKIRMSRLKQRESEKFGDRILQGGDMEKSHKEFLEWALQYDEGLKDGRSLHRHEEWMKTLSCPLLRIEGNHSVETLIQKTQEKLLELGLVSSSKKR